MKIENDNLNQAIKECEIELEHIYENKSNFKQMESLIKEIYSKNQSIEKNRKIIGSQINKLQAFLEDKNRIFNFYSDTLERLLNPKKFNITLIHKPINGIPYIKGRIYWDNKQREVQIGSIPNVIKMIKDLIDKKIINQIKGVDKDTISWKDIKSNSKIISAIKYIGKIKFKIYLIKHFEFRDVDLKLPAVQNKHNHLLEMNIPNNNPDNSVEQLDWYADWRKNNL